MNFNRNVICEDVNRSVRRSVEVGPPKTGDQRLSGSSLHFVPPSGQEAGTACDRFAMPAAAEVTPPRSTGAGVDLNDAHNRGRITWYYP